MKSPEQTTGDTRPIALLDSGVGGLSILREVRRLLPHENLIYLADQAHVPYGPRPLLQIREIVEGITRFFLEHQAKTIVIACNAASAASLHAIRTTFPDMPFVGMEPAVKPAAENTRTGSIGVVTTQATFQGELFASVVGRFADGIEVFTEVCPEFVMLVEQGRLNGTAVSQTVRTRLEALLAHNIDHLVLGCTHFPFLQEIIMQEIGPDVAVIDPGPAVARQIERVTADMRNLQTKQGKVTHFTSGDAQSYSTLVENLLGQPPDEVISLHWHEHTLHRASA